MVMQIEQVFRPTSLQQAIALLQQYPQARPVAGATDVTVELAGGRRPTSMLVDLTAIDGLRTIRRDHTGLAIGALTTHADLVSSADVGRDAFALAQAAVEIGAPQIRNRATLVGNLVTASPANDTITALIALDAELLLCGPDGERVVALDAFYRGVRATVLRPAELVREVRIPTHRRHSTFLKLGLRRAQAIAVINVAVAWSLTAEGTISAARLALGAVAPTIVRSHSAEALLEGRSLLAVDPAAVGRAAAEGLRPIDDVRGPARYRVAAVSTLAARAVERLVHGTERAEWPAEPIRLQVAAAEPAREAPPTATNAVRAVVNGRPLELNARVTLLAALRDAGLTGTKEGCGEGECGACTVWLNGAAVMACLTPAAQADGAQVTTIEGLAADASSLHHVQQAFISHGAVQCGFCIPGMIMAAAQLLDEVAEPSVAQIQTALSGNICRCTGYRKIIEAVQSAAAARRAFT